MARRIAVGRRGRRNPLTPEQHREATESRILFDLLQDRAKARHWKDAFEVRFGLADRRTQDPPIPREAVRDISQRLLRAINFYHGAAMVLELESRTVRPHRGEPAAYATFDGYELVVGSTGYAAW